MYKKTTNSSDIKSKQLQLCELVSQIWDAESLDIILGSVQNLIRVKRLVMSVDASCGSSQAFVGMEENVTVANVTENVEDQSEDRANMSTQIIVNNEEDRQTNTHVAQEEQRRGEILVYSTQEASDCNATTSVMVVNEDGDYDTQVICNTLPPPRISIVHDLEDSDSDSVFDIDWNGNDVEDDQHVEGHPVQQADERNQIVSEPQVEVEDSDSDSLFDDIDWIGSDVEDDEAVNEGLQVQQEDDDERNRTVADYINTPLQDINAQCPYKLTVEEVQTMFNNDDLRRDFSSMNENMNNNKDQQKYESPSVQSQSTFFKYINCFYFINFSNKGHNQSCRGD